LNLKDAIRFPLRQLGFDIIRYKAELPGEYPSEGLSLLESSSPDFSRLLNRQNIDLIFDVGANTGVYAATLFKNGFKGSIVSFEPLSEAYNQLVDKSKAYRLWQVAERCALGDSDSEVEINVSANLESSSILPMLKACEDSAPDARYRASEKVAMRRLDAIAERYLDNVQAPFLKLDVQGFEDKVLAGAKESLVRIKGIQIELSLLPLYEGQKLWRQLIDEILTLGFELHSLMPGFTDRQTGKLLQMDAIFFRV
jgi:FkbM family methyltransferase